MRRCKYILLIYILLSANEIKAGEPLYWLTYSHSKYVYSPGIEACYHFRDRLGVNLGLGVYYQNPDHSKITNITHQDSFGFYNVNLGASSYLFKSKVHSIGLIAGFKLYHGPDYKRLRYYEEGAYYIYYDASALQPDYGLDLGIYYNYKKLSLLSKWDFARNRFRIGIGYRFKSR